MDGSGIKELFVEVYMKKERSYVARQSLKYNLESFYKA